MFNQNKKNILLPTFLILVSYIFFLIFHWPYLWESPISNFFDYFTKSKSWIFSYYILFEGKYLLTNGLPDSYIFKWIGVTTPVFNLIILIFGTFFIYRRFSLRFLKINSSNNFHCDFWRNTGEMIDYFVIFNITSILLLIIFLDVPFVSGWRHLYFLNFFIVYICTFCLYFLRLKFKKYKKLFGIFFIIFFSYNIYKIIIFHPYQSLYFNEFLRDKNSYLVDRDGLSRMDSIKKVLFFGKDKKSISVANASFIPYYRIADAFNKEKIRKIKFAGQLYDKADYIYNNFVYEVNPENNDKYEIPQNFEKIYVLEIDGIKIYEIYSRIKSK